MLKFTYLFFLVESIADLTLRLRHARPSTVVWVEPFLTWSIIVAFNLAACYLSTSLEWVAKVVRFLIDDKSLANDAAHAIQRWLIGSWQVHVVPVV